MSSREVLDYSAADGAEGHSPQPGSNAGEVLRYAAAAEMVDYLFPIPEPGDNRIMFRAKAYYDESHEMSSVVARHLTTDRGFKDTVRSRAHLLKEKIATQVGKIITVSTGH